MKGYDFSDQEIQATVYDPGDVPEFHPGDDWGVIRAIYIPASANPFDGVPGTSSSAGGSWGNSNPT